VQCEAWEDKKSVEPTIRKSTTNKNNNTNKNRKTTMLHLLNKNKNSDKKKNNFKDAVGGIPSVDAIVVVAADSLELVGGGGLEAGPIQPPN
jgi:hypothetical protein